MTAEPAPRLTEHVLFLACTRPAMVAGVTLEAMGVNVMLTASAFLAGHSLLWLLAGPILHLVFAGVCRTDPNAFRILWLFLETKGRARNATLWGGASASPLPLRRARRPRELRLG